MLTDGNSKFNCSEVHYIPNHRMFMAYSPEQKVQENRILVEAVRLTLHDKQLSERSRVEALNANEYVLNHPDSSFEDGNPLMNFGDR